MISTVTCQEQPILRGQCIGGLPNAVGERRGLTASTTVDY